LEGIVIENKNIRVVVTPEFGARIISLIYKPTETEYAWHNPRVPVKKPNYEIDFEDPSGFFNCVPTTQACTFKGKELPAAGEVASEPWTLSSKVSDSDSVALKMERSCKIYPMIIRKEMSIRGEEPIIRLSYENAILRKSTLFSKDPVFVC
jgi:hypothetical protein